MTRRDGRRSRGVGPSSAVLVKRLSWSGSSRCPGAWEPENLSAGLRPGGQVDDGQLNQPLPGPGPGGALADGALAGGARWTSAGRALKPPPHEVASVLGAAGDQLVSLMCTRIRALPAEFTLVMVTVRAGRYDGSPSHPAGDFGSLAARP